MCGSQNYFWKDNLASGKLLSFKLQTELNVREKQVQNYLLLTKRELDNIFSPKMIIHHQDSTSQDAFIFYSLQKNRVTWFSLKFEFGTLQFIYRTNMEKLAILAENNMVKKKEHATF